MFNFIAETNHSFQDYKHLLNNGKFLIDKNGHLAADCLASEDGLMDG